MVFCKQASVKFLFFVSFFLLLAGCTQSPTGRQQLLLVSDNEMSQMGLSAFEELKKKGNLVQDRKKISYVRCVTDALLDQLPQDESKNWEVEIFEDDTPNAFALPGKKIGIHTGMLKIAKTPSQLAAVIGHEIGHVQSKHGAERLSINQVTTLGHTLAALLLSDTEYRTEITAALGLGTQFGLLLPYSRKHESEADNIGLHLMAQAGFDPAQSVRLWQNMSETEGKEVPEFLSTHPANQTRIDQLNADMQRANKLYQQALARGIRPTCTLK